MKYCLLIIVFIIQSTSLSASENHFYHVDSNCVTDTEGLKCWGNSAGYFDDLSKPWFTHAKNITTLHVGQDTTCFSSNSKIDCLGVSFTNSFLNKLNSENGIDDFYIGKGFWDKSGLTHDILCVLKESKVFCQKKYRNDVYAHFEVEIAAVANAKKVVVATEHICTASNREIECRRYGNLSVLSKTIQTEGEIDDIRSYYSTLDASICFVVEGKIKCWDEYKNKLHEIPGINDALKLSSGNGRIACGVNNNAAKCWSITAYNEPAYSIIKKLKISFKKQLLGLSVNCKSLNKCTLSSYTPRELNFKSVYSNSNWENKHSFKAFPSIDFSKVSEFAQFRAKGRYLYEPFGGIGAGIIFLENEKIRMIGSSYTQQKYNIFNLDNLALTSPRNISTWELGRNGFDGFDVCIQHNGGYWCLQPWRDNYSSGIPCFLSIPENYALTSQRSTCFIKDSRFFCDISDSWIQETKRIEYRPLVF